MALDFDFLSTVYFGNTLLQYVSFVTILIASFVFGKIANFVIKNYLSQLANYTKSKLDDIFLHALETPLLFFVLLIGFWFALEVVDFGVGAEKTLQNLIGAATMLGVAWFLIKLVDGFVREIVLPMTRKSASRLDDQLVPVISRGLKIIVVIVALILIADTFFGIDVTAPLVGLGIGGIAIAFAAQQTIADVFGGFSIFTSRPFVVGEWIAFDQTTGMVEQVGIRTTRIRTSDQQLLTVPNSKLASSVITNLTETAKRRVTMDLGLVYGTPSKKIEQAKQIIRNILLSVNELEKNPEPF